MGLATICGKVSLSLFRNTITSDALLCLLRNLMHQTLWCWYATIPGKENLVLYRFKKVSDLWADLLRKMYYCTLIFVDHSTGNPSLTLDNKLSEYLVLYCPRIQNCLIKSLNVLNQDDFTALLFAFSSRSHVSEKIGKGIN